MKRRLVWLQLLIGWLPIWALFVALIMGGHPGESMHSAALLALRMIITAAIPGVLVQRFTARVPWPRPFRARFVGIHALGAIAYAVIWILCNSVLESLWVRHAVIVVGPGLGPFLVTGVWIYIMIAGVSYAALATERAARAETLAASSQLAALRAQLHPHFLFNALHTIVHLIPREPARAAKAAEQVAALLRTTIEDDRDLVTLEEEWAFVARYLELEHIRFGDRLQVDVDMTDDARRTMIPSFAVQTLVENAVRHGAAPREEPTQVAVQARTIGGQLTVRVHDTGAGASREQVAARPGTGLARLRERLSVLYGTRGRLEIDPGLVGTGFTATLILPAESAE